MRIAMLSPTSMSGGEEAETTRRSRQALLNRLAPAGMEIALVDNPDGPRAIETMADEYNGIPGMLRAAVARQGEFDGYITGCFGEPGLDAVRELVRIPAVGCCGPAVHMANLMGRRFAVLAPVQSTVEDTADLIGRYGLGTRLACIKPLDIPVLEIRRDRDRVVERAGRVAADIVREHRVSAIVLGCMSLAYQEVAPELAAVAGVPVINPLHTAIHAIGYLAGV